MAFDDDAAIAFGGLPEFADGRVSDPVGQDDILADKFDGLELAERGRDRAAPDFFRRRGGGARVRPVDRRTELPSGDDCVAEPEFTLGLRRRELSTERLSARVMVGARSERLVADPFTAPDGRDAQQVGIEAGPGIVRQLDDQAARREIILTRSFATGVEDRGEEGEIGLDPRAPRLWLVGRRFFHRLRRKTGQEPAKQGKE